MLFRVKTTDAATISTAILVMCATALLAGYLPARQGCASSGAFGARERRNYEIPEHIILVEDKAMNTGQNVILAREKVKDFGVKDLLLIGKISSKRRYIMTVRKQWPEIRRIGCHGVNYFSVPVDQWWKDLEFRTRVFSECRKISSYIEKGLISDVRITNGIVM